MLREHRCSISLIATMSLIVAALHSVISGFGVVMISLPLNVMHFVLNACFHIKIRAGQTLLDFIKFLAETNHEFALEIKSGDTISLHDYICDETVGIETLVVKMDGNDFWLLILDNKGWSITHGN